MYDWLLQYEWFDYVDAFVVDHAWKLIGLANTLGFFMGWFVAAKLYN